MKKLFLSILSLSSFYAMAVIVDQPQATSSEILGVTLSPEVEETLAKLPSETRANIHERLLRLKSYLEKGGLEKARAKHAKIFQKRSQGRLISPAPVAEKPMLEQ